MNLRTQAVKLFPKTTKIGINEIIVSKFRVKPSTPFTFDGLTVCIKELLL
jgi:hypothetical protein